MKFEDEFNEKDRATLVRCIAAAVAIIVAIAVLAALLTRDAEAAITPLDDCADATIKGAPGEPTTQRVCERMLIVASWLYPRSDSIAVSCDPIVTRPIWRSHDCFVTTDNAVYGAFELAVQRRKCANVGRRGVWRQEQMANPTRCFKMWLAPRPVRT